MEETSDSSCFYFKTISVVSSIHQVDTPIHHVMESLFIIIIENIRFRIHIHFESTFFTRTLAVRCSTVYSASSRAADKKLFF